MFVMTVFPPLSSASSRSQSDVKIADSASCCTGSHNTNATCPSSGVQFYSYFSTYLLLQPCIQIFCPDPHPFYLLFLESEALLIDNNMPRRERVPKFLCLRV